MTTVNCRIFYNDQNGSYANTTGAGYVNAAANGNYNFVPGSVAAFRFPTQIPSGVNINSATLKLWYNSKFGDQNMSSNHTLYAEVTSSSAAPLVDGEQYQSRPKTFIVTRDVNILANTGNNVMTVDVTAFIADVYSKGLVPGGHVTFFVLCNTESGDMNWKLAADGAAPELIIDYWNENEDGQFWDFNLLANPDFAVNAEHWGTNVFFNAFAVSGAAVARDTTFLREGRPTLKWTCPTPEAGKACGPVTSALLNITNSSYILSGWIYIPSALNAPVNANFYFLGGDDNIGVRARDTWIPFSTGPVATTNIGGVFPTIIIGEGFNAGQNIWLSDCAVYRSDMKQMPFSSQTTNQSEVTHYLRGTPGRGPMARKIRPRVYHNSANPAALKPRKKYLARADGIWKYVSSTRESTSWDDLVTNGMTFDQLRATGKTYDDMEADTIIV